MKIRVGIMTAPHIDAVSHQDGTTTLRGVRIGIGFHWDRKEDQRFEGKMEIRPNTDGTETAINTLDIEDYLTSVISSEMAATAPMELLKAHAVISRSWAVRAIGHTDHPRGAATPYCDTDDAFDVCADDHCQRYEGIGRRNPRAVEAVRATAHEVLLYGDEVCDCRYHKCCGGRTEIWETCWDQEGETPYLESVECPYCGKARPESSLNNYDLETNDYHDWTVRYSREELSEIIRNKTGVDYGEIQHLRPLSRGESGRIDQLEIVGTKYREVIGKELAIRKALSRSCLYSSWFEVEETEKEFILRGHGWGHGVGLCQIGAAVMAEEGHTYREILAFYYRHTRLGRRE